MPLWTSTGPTRHPLMPKVGCWSGARPAQANWRCRQDAECPNARSPSPTDGAECVARTTTRAGRESRQRGLWLPEATHSEGYRNERVQGWTASGSPHRPMSALSPLVKPKSVQPSERTTRRIELAVVARFCRWGRVFVSGGWCLCVAAGDAGPVLSRRLSFD